MLTDYRGIDGLGEVLRPLRPEALSLAVLGHHAQGVACLEVTFMRVPVRRVPSRDAEAIAMRYQGELVFARSQSFDQWVRLAGEDRGGLDAGRHGGHGGAAAAPPRPPPPRLVAAVRPVAKRARFCGQGRAGDQKAQSDLKDAEARARLAAVAAFERLQFDEEACSWRVSEACPEQEDPVALGLLAREDLQVGEAGMARIVRHIFSRQLPRFCSDEPGLRRLVPELRRSGGSVPLPVDGGDEDEAPEGRPALRPGRPSEARGRVGPGREDGGSPPGGLRRVPGGHDAGARGPGLRHDRGREHLRPRRPSQGRDL
ncbi:unnamed protein product [Prorocentrum cordatum]|uniref:Uncharacterized protein n=1 Tax=Prorocentrum cordatum TaxID=2364126 RepID=A0ABN9SGD1_9DINO|nr:unnamed protein product [Polarella glacialis]